MKLKFSFSAICRLEELEKQPSSKVFASLQKGKLSFLALRNIYTAARTTDKPDITVKEAEKEIDEIISTKAEIWTWAHVMRVMMDEGILIKLRVNRFDTIIRSMIPGKGRDTVRKNGDYTYLMGQEMPWSQWHSNFDSNLSSEKTICNMIALKFAPLLERTIKMQY